MKKLRPTILPRYERMLVAAASERIGAPARSRLRIGIRKNVPRFAAIAFACVAFAGTAVAAGVWNPPIGSEAPNTPPPATTSTPVPAAMADALEVFRREPTSQDHSPAVEATLSTLGSQFASGLRPGSVRILTSNARGEATVLLSVERSAFTSGNAAQLFGSGEPACIVAPAAGTEAAPECFGIDKILTGEAGSEVERVDRMTGYGWGLVPDGVASVTVRLGDGVVRDVPVANNYFHFGWGDAGVKPINGEVPSVIRTSPFRDSVWHDAEGNVVPKEPIG